jgi:DNA polymerase-3 subunit delta'
VKLFGHDAAVAAFLDAMRAGRLHHAWLLAGPQGVGKGLFAGMAALRLLAEGQGARYAQPWRARRSSGGKADPGRQPP